MAKKSVAPRVANELSFTREKADGCRNNWVVSRPDHYYDARVLGADYAAQVMRLSLESEFHGYMAMKQAMQDPNWMPSGSVEEGFLNMILACAMAGLREVEKNGAEPFDYEAAVEAAGLNA